MSVFHLVHGLTQRGTILWANQAELDLLGYTRDEYVGHHIAEFHADPEVIEHVLSCLSAGQTLRNYEARLRCKDGSIKYVLINSNVLWQDGEFVHTRCFTRDITERKQAEELLKELDRRKDAFVATVAHELRQPLGAIQAALGLMRLRPDRDQGERARSTVERQVAQLARLVDDLMDAAHISQGTVTLNRHRVALNDIIDTAVTVVQPLVRNQGQELQLSIASAPVWLEADPQRLQQVFSNLLTNAAKFTPRGGLIHVAVIPQGDVVAVRVRDNGRGIPREVLPRVFDMFAQASQDGRGLGVGLAVVRGLVDRPRS